jgi:hypothetical protein
MEKIVRRREPPNCAQQGFRRQDKSDRKQLLHGAGVNLSFNTTAGEDGFELRPEKQSAGSDGIAQWLDAKPISGQHEPSMTGIPDSEAEHASQEIHTAHPMVLVQVDDDFDIRIGMETMAGGLQVSTQFLVVVDLSVAHNRDRAVFIGNGLIAVLQVDDAQSAEAETDARFNKVTVPIRSTVGHHVRHSMKHIPVDQPPGI